MFHRILTYFFIFFKYIGISKVEKKVEKKKRKNYERENKIENNKKFKIDNNPAVILKISNEELQNNYNLTDYLYDYQGIEV